MKVGEGIWVGHDQDTLYKCMKLTKNKTNVWKSLDGWMGGWIVQTLGRLCSEVKTHPEALPGGCSLNNHGSSGFTLMMEKKTRCWEQEQEPSLCTKL